MSSVIDRYLLKDSLQKGSGREHFHPIQAQFDVPKPADFMALSSHNQTGAPFVTWNLGNSILESV